MNNEEPEDLTEFDEVSKIAYNTHVANGWGFVEGACWERLSEPNKQWWRRTIRAAVLHDRKLVERHQDMLKTLRERIGIK